MVKHENWKSAVSQGPGERVSKRQPSDNQKLEELISGPQLLQNSHPPTLTLCRLLLAGKPFQIFLMPSLPSLLESSTDSSWQCRKLLPRICSQPGTDALRPLTDLFFRSKQII